MRRLLIGVIGHVDHGKTALVRALTGMETDRLPEEKRRGISIALGFAHLGVSEAEIDFVDMPGHERFVRTMIAGATGIDAVLLALDAREGVKPQTAEHVAIAGLLGIEHAVLAVTKCDLAPRAAAEAVGRDGVALMRRAGLAAEAPVLTSASSGVGLDALRAMLSRTAERTEPRIERGFAWLPIDRAFSLAGHGTIVTGTLRCGRLSGTDLIELLPQGTAVRVRGVQVHRQAVAAALPGQRVAVNLRGVEAATLHRGQALATLGLLRPASWIGVALRSLEGASPLRNGTPLALLAGSLECEARLRLLDRDTLQAGESCVAQLHCRPGVALPAREPFVLRATSPQSTVGGGRVLDPGMRRLRRGRTERLLRLVEATPEQVVLGEIEAAGTAGCALATLARLAGLAPARVRAVFEGAPVRLLAGIALPAAHAARLALEADRLVTASPSGVSRERILAAMPRGVAPAAVEAILAELCKQGRLRQHGGLFHTRDTGRERARATDKTALAQRISALVQQAKLTPPDTKALMAAHPNARAAVERLARDGVLVRTLDRVQKREILFHRDAIRHAQVTLAPHLVAPGLLLGEAGAILGITRKYAVPLMEYFDAIQFTRRVQDRRVLAETGRLPN